MDSARDSYKKWGIILIVFLLIFIPAEIALTRPNALSNFQLMLKLASQEKPKVVSLNKNINQVLQEDHPSLYYLDLEYDPSTKKLSKTDSGGNHGDLPFLLIKPSDSPLVFSYKIETISIKGDTLFTGWKSPYKTVISDKNGKYQLNIVVPYVSGETINIYSAQSEKIWEEKVK